MRVSYRVAGAVLRMVFRLMYRLERGPLPELPTGPVLLASNHQSNLDPPLIGAFHAREIHFVAKKQLFERPLMAAVIRFFNAIPIDRSGVDRAALKEIRATLDGGEDLLVFPEGTRSRDGRLGTPRHGLGMIMAMAKVDVLPLFVDGSRLRPGFLVGRPTLRLRYGPIMRWAELGADLDELPRSEWAPLLTSRVFDRIRQLSGETEDAL